MNPSLQLSQVSRRFGGLLAVDDVSFDVGQGEILGLIGPNGAGKTTLMNLISGLLTPTHGEITLGGERLNGQPAHRIARLGIARTFQVMRPFPGLSVRENVAIGGRFGHAQTRRGMAEALEKAESTLAWVGLATKADAPVASLTTGERKKLELARALAMEPRVLLLDEVVGGLNPREVGELMDLVRRVNSNGIAVLLIEHVMKAVMGLCHRVVVLHHGKLIATGTPEQIRSNDAVVRAYLGDRYGAGLRPQ